MSYLNMKALTAQEKERIRPHYTDTEFSRFGSEGYLLPTSFEQHAAAIRSMELRAGDVWVHSFPRSGTTMTQEIVWLINNNLDYETASKIKLEHRYYFIEYVLNMELKEVRNYVDAVHRRVRPEALPAPRFLLTHLPLQLLPPRLLDTGRVVYVARDPRDVAVSNYHFLKHCLLFYTGDFKTFWNLFVDNLIQCPTPYFPSVKQAWALRHHPNMLFIFYDDMIKDLRNAIRRISNFFGKKYTDEEINKLSEHMQFDTFKNNKAVNRDYIKETAPLYSQHEFVRKGGSGGWREWFDAEMQAQAAGWMQEQLRDTDLRFPDT